MKSTSSKLLARKFALISIISRDMVINVFFITTLRIVALFGSKAMFIFMFMILVKLFWIGVMETYASAQA